MQKLAMVVVSALALSTFACGEDDPEASGPPTEGDRVFAVGASKAANTADLEGVWEATAPRVQSGLESLIRLELRADRVVAAVRCSPTDGSSPTVLGREGRAVITDATIDVPEEVRVSKPIGKSYCGVVVPKAVLPQCDLRKLASERSWCFELANGKLTVREETAAIEYAKVAD